MRVRVERGAGDAGTEALRARFDALDRLIENNFAALELIAQSSSKMTVKTARIVLTKVEAMAAEYSKIVGSENAVDDTAGVASIGIGFDQAVKGLAETDLLPPKAVALVMPIDSESMHFYINKLHQAAEREVFHVDVESPATMTVKLGQGARERAVALVDLSEHPLVSNGRIVSPAFRALVEAMTRSKDTPTGSLALRDHRFSGHFKLGAHSAEVDANFLPPDEGGRISVRYQEWGTGYDNQTRLYYVARLLQKTGFHVEQSNGYLTAIIDKDHASQTVDEMTDTFALVIQALHATVGVDFALPILVQGAKTSEEVGERIDQWVDVVLGEGTLPFYIHDDHSGMVAGWNAYQAINPGREQRAGLNRTLASLGLNPIPAGEALGQRAIDRFVNAPIEAAIARGQLRLTKEGKLEKVPGHDELASVAAGLADGAAAARMAEVVSSLDPGLLPFSTVGSLGALNVERAERRLEPGDLITVYALRDPRTGQLGLAEVLLSDLKPGGSPAPPGAGRALQAARRAGLSRGALRAQSRGPRALLGSVEVRAHSRDLARQARAGPRRQPGPRTARARARDLRQGQGRVGRLRVRGALHHARRPRRHPRLQGRHHHLGRPAQPRRHHDPRDGHPGRHPFARRVARRRRRLRVPGVRRALQGRRPRGPAPPRRGRRGGARRGRARAARSRDGRGGGVSIQHRGPAARRRGRARALRRGPRREGPRLLGEEPARHAVPFYIQKSALLRAALDGLGARALARPEAAADLAAFYQTLPKGEDKLASWTEASAADFFQEARRGALELLREKRGATRAAMSVEAVERSLRAGEARAARLSAIASALGRSKDALVEADVELAGLREEAKARGAVLLAEDVADLQKHARMFPNATVEVLPRLKAAIAKAKRRGVAPEAVAAWERKVAALELTREASMRARAPVVLALRQVLDMDVPRVGGKAAKLGEISQVVANAGGEVPPGLALTVDAYRQFLREAGIAEKLERVATDPELRPRSARPARAS